MCFTVYLVKCVYVYMHTRVLLCMHGGHKLLPSFYHAGPRDQTQVISLGGEHAHLLSHLSGPGDVLPPMSSLKLLIYVPSQVHRSP